MLEAVMPAADPSDAHWVFPDVLRPSAEAIAEVFLGWGWTVSGDSVPELAFSESPPEIAAERWVPAPRAGLARTLVLFGSQPWETSFENDHLIELAAMKNREALKLAGHRLIFVDWPRGARMDAEIDLRPGEMAGIFEASLANALQDVRDWNARLIKQVQQARHIQINCPLGTDISLAVNGRIWIPEDCLLSEAEPAIYLPGGEIYVPAREDSAQGTVVFFYAGEPRRARFEHGLLIDVTHTDGTPDPERAEEMGAGREPLCEFGIGTNPWAPPWQIGTIYEKSAGTVHVAVGGNAHFGGQRDSPRHSDLVIRDPILTVDGVRMTLPPPRWKEFDTGQRRS